MSDSFFKEKSWKAWKQKSYKAGLKQDCNTLGKLLWRFYEKVQNN